jgi:hypothetical protein
MMEPQTYFIRSVMVQNIIMGIVVAILLGLLIRFVLRRERKLILVVTVWGGIALWFFNGPFWGFSAVTVGPGGLEVHYGFLSVFRNTTLPVNSEWKIQKYLGGIRKLKHLYFFKLPGHASLKVRGADKLETMEALGAAIDSLNGRPMGGLEERPVNL